MALALVDHGLDGENHAGFEFQALAFAAVYTRPAEYKGWRVPDVLLSGHDRRIAEWRLQQAQERTERLRPDLLREE